MRKLAEKKEKPPFDYTRPLSWSAISSFKWSPEQWYKKYVMGVEQPTSKEMIFGKTVGERIASDPEYLPKLPRLPIFEHKLLCTLEDIPLIGFIDSYDQDNKILYEYKTGRNMWSKKRVDDHGQIDMYLLLLFLQEKIRPEEVTCKLFWLPTHYENKEITFIDENRVIAFPTKRTIVDISNFRTYIIETRAKMIQYYENHS